MSDEKKTTKTTKTKKTTKTEGKRLVEKSDKRVMYNLLDHYDLHQYLEDINDTINILYNIKSKTENDPELGKFFEKLIKDNVLPKLQDVSH